MKFEDMKLESKPMRIDKPDDDRFISSNLKNFLALNIRKNVAIEVERRFNDYPELQRQNRDLVQIGKELVEAIHNIWSYIGNETNEFDNYYNLLGRAIEMGLGDLTKEELKEMGVE